MEPNLEYVRSAAYHEGAHIVVAAVQGIPLGDKGVRLDKWGNGIAYYHDKRPDGSTNAGSEQSREKTIIATAAGWIAQNKIYPCPPTGAFYDINQVNALLSEMYADNSSSWWAERESLLIKSERLVELHWAAIESLAFALLSKPDISRVRKQGDWSQEPLEKHLKVDEISDILGQFGITATLNRSAI